MQWKNKKLREIIIIQKEEITSMETQIKNIPAHKTFIIQGLRLGSNEADICHREKENVNICPHYNNKNHLLR